MQYIVVYEQSPNNWSAYVPDLPGCVAAGDTKEETRQLIAEAIAFHVETSVEYGDPLPRPGTWAEVIDVDVPSPQPAQSG
ncbi:MAG: type II toxin-antitoxin system HicB family antitoxin [Dehalococcoidia bacterium]